MNSEQYRHRILGGVTRSRLLSLLREASRPLSVRDLARGLGLHPNTVREQLDLLIEAELVTSDLARPVGRGRPSRRYVLRQQTEDPDPFAYRALAGALAAELEQRPDPRAASLAAGERWGRSLVERTSEAIDRQEALHRLIGLLEETGFAPERTMGADDPIRLRRCPFGSLARERGEVVCGVHLGLMQGALRGLDAPLEAVSLEPFVAPDLCLAHLEVRTDV